MLSLHICCIYIFFFNDTATTEIYTLSLHDALPISNLGDLVGDRGRVGPGNMDLDGRLRFDRWQRLELWLLDERPDELPDERCQDDERAPGDLEGLLVADVEAVAGRRPHHQRGERLDQDRLGCHRVPLGHDT